MAERKSFLLRTSPEILEALRRWSDQEMRSVNAQVEYVLRNALRRQGFLGDGKQPPKP
ncbi:MAG: Arc family DNA binding domain-containing protein [bacterium]|nr:Arc family DNA binding domain-containing protein [bacterium]